MEVTQDALIKNVNDELQDTARRADGDVRRLFLERLLLLGHRNATVEHLQPKRLSATIKTFARQKSGFPGIPSKFD